jgi:two-component system sensor histidine kinase HydH
MNIGSKTSRLSLPREVVASPWIIIAAATLLAVVVIVLAVFNIHREKASMSKILSEKGAALIKSFEAGTRTGMMGMMGSQMQLQPLLEETAKQEDILFIAVTDARGVVLAHNQRQLIGSRFSPDNPLADLEPKEAVQWELVNQPPGQRSFVVYRTFTPFSRGRRGHMPMHRGRSRHGFLERTQHIFIGLDVAPFVQARRVDMRNTLALSAVLLLLGLTGVIVLFWAQRVRMTRNLLQHQQALSEVVVSNLPVGLIVLDRDGTVAFLNRPAGSLLDQSPEDQTGLPADRVLPQPLLDLMRNRSHQETVLEREISYSLNGREEMPISLSMASIMTEDSVYAGEVIILRDLRQVKDLENTVKRQEKLAAIGNLAAGVAHEIRNPLSSIKGFATHFKERFSEGSPDKQAASILIQEVDRLNRVVTELLEFSRPSDIEAKTVDLRELIDRSLAFVQEDAAQKNIEVDVSWNTPSDRIEVDPDRLSQALLNLYLNAVQAMESGGSLQVAVSGDDGQVRIDVTDSGPGIAPEMINTVFDPYYTSKGSGTGLGLAIVHKIVEAHRGQIRVFSRPGRGTTFTLLLPKKQPFNSSVS